MLSLEKCYITFVEENELLYSFAVSNICSQFV